MKLDRTAIKSILSITLVTALLLAGLNHYSGIVEPQVSPDSNGDGTVSAIEARRAASAEDHRKNVMLTGKATDNKVLAAGAVVEIDEDTYLIEDTYDKDRMWSEVEYALSRRYPVICFKDYEMKSMDELFALDYGSFWAESISWHTEESDDGTYYFYRINYYDLTDGEIADMKDEIDRCTEQAITELPYCSDEWEAAKAVHDYLIAHITYDESMALPHTHDLYGALVNRNAVCSAYASSFCHLMRKLGYNNTGISYSEDHTWNKVITNTHDRYVDVTWDDIDESDSDGNPYINYSYFFIDYDETAAIESHKFADIEADYEVSDYYTEYIDYNYYTRTGYYEDSFDSYEIARDIREQMQNGVTAPSIRFRYDDDYEYATSDAGIDAIVTEMDFYGYYQYWCVDEMNTVVFAFDPD